MNVHPLLGIVAVLLFMAALTAAIKGLERVLRPHPEVLRKLMHVGMGLAVLPFPWLFHSRWPVVALASLATAALLLVKLRPRLNGSVGSVLSGVERPTLGEVYFPISVGLLFVLASGQWLFYVVPLLILALGDAMAALIGIRYGTLRYLTSDGMKSAEGSIAFFTVAFFSVHIPLLLCTSIGRPETLLISAILGLLAMLLEAIAWRGVDNLFIPLGAFAFLKLYVDMSAAALLLRLAVTIALVAFTLSWRRRSTLDDSALIGSALFGYAAAMLGGPLWLVAPALFFLGICLAWPRRERSRYSTIYVVIAVASTPLLCLLIYARWWWLGFLFPYSLAFAAHFAFIGISHLPLIPSQRPTRLRILYIVLAAWAAVWLPVLAVTLVRRPELATPSLILFGSAAGGGALVLLAAGGAAFYHILCRVKLHPERLAILHVAGATLAFVLCFLATAAWFLLARLLA